MSLSEIVRNRFKKNIRINKLHTQDEVEKYIISPPEMVNKELNFDGTIDQ